MTGRAVPPEFLPRFPADAPGSADALLAAAEREMASCGAGNPRDREAALTLLAADAYVTHACVQALTGGADARALGRIAQRVAHGWWEGWR